MKTLACLSLLILMSIPCYAQSLSANQLCLHNGGEYYAAHPGLWDFPSSQCGVGRYFPGFAHQASTPWDQAFPLKLAGYGWDACQPGKCGGVWYFESCLQASMDNPWDKKMSFDYPQLYSLGVTKTTGYPAPMYGAILPTSIPQLAGNEFLFPSSRNGMNATYNIFAVNCASWNIPSTLPFLGFSFGLYWGCGSAISTPSSHSIWQFNWCCLGPHFQYCLLDGDTPDCAGGKGNKGRNYSLIMDDAGAGSLWYWSNSGQGCQEEWAMCLFVCDAITIPLNIPGGVNPSNPFAVYGYDCGAAVFTPYLSSGCYQLGFKTEDYAGAGGQRVILAAFGSSPGWPSYGPFNWRVPHGWDFLTRIFISLAPLFIHIPNAAYPASMFGSTVGGHTVFIPVPMEPGLIGMDIRYSSFPANPSAPMSASFMSAFF